MKKIISIALTAILAGLAISCQKEEAVSDKTDAVQYTFNIIVNDRAGFDSDASTKGSESHKYCWENGDKIFLFFKPTDDNLLENTYATLTYDGSEWGVNAPDLSGLGEDGGTLSAVYVYNLDGNVYPEFSSADNQWTIATGNTFYNCQTGVDYTVSDNVISASLDLVAPTNFVQFYVASATGALTCDKVKGWKDIAIGSDMAVSNVTCTGYMDGFTNSGDSNVKEYYGRIVSGTSLEDQDCKFSVVKNGKVYERSATPSSDARSFKMNTSDGYWQEAVGKLPGLFTVGKGADGIAGTVDDVQVRFSQGNLQAIYNSTTSSYTWDFAANQYSYVGNAVGNTSIDSQTDGAVVDLFGWSTDATYNNWGIHTKTGTTQYYTTGSFNDWGKAYCEKNSITPDDTWRTLTKDEWCYLFAYTASGANTDIGSPRYNLFKTGVNVCGKENCVVIAPDGWNLSANSLQAEYSSISSPMTWEQAEAAGLVCLPAAGYRYGSDVSDVGGCGSYWSSTADDGSNAYSVFFSSDNVNPVYGDSRGSGDSVRLITESN